MLNNLFFVNNQAEIPKEAKRLYKTCTCEHLHVTLYKKVNIIIKVFFVKVTEVLNIILKSCLCVCIEGAHHVWDGYVGHWGLVGHELDVA